MIGTLQLDFREDQPRILAPKLVDMPSQAASFNSVAQLLDRAIGTKRSQHLLCVRQGHFIFEL